MRKILCLGLMLVVAGSAYAELQNVEVGGEIVIRGRYWHNVYTSPTAQRIHIPASLLPMRPIGSPLGVVGRFDWDGEGNDLSFVEQATRINVRADFTNNVCAFIELDSVDIWGEDFRSNYITGADARTTTADDVEVVESYIQVSEMFDLPLRMRIGRQVIEMGKGWLVGSHYSPTRKFSFDAIRFTYDVENFEVDAWWSKLADTSPVEEDGDVDFYGIYATYKGFEPLSVSAYWLYLRDARSIDDTNFIWPLERLENVFGLDDYDVTDLNTLGIRLFGQTGQLDYDLEVAYQLGEADAVGSMFLDGLYGDDSAEFDAWAADLQVGYQFDVTWQPRVYLQLAYFEGSEERGLSREERRNPFDMPNASLSFNRLFCDGSAGYSNILDDLEDLSNFQMVRLGAQFRPTEKLSGDLSVAWFGVNEEFAYPVYIGFADFRIPVLPSLSTWTEETGRDMGVLAKLDLRYDYTEDLYFAIRYEHLFTGDALDEGSYLHNNGLSFSGGTDQEDADYIHFITGIKF